MVITLSKETITLSFNKVSYNSDIFLLDYVKDPSDSLDVRLYFHQQADNLLPNGIILLDMILLYFILYVAYHSGRAKT
jgi:hypothetical protein